MDKRQALGFAKIFSDRIVKEYNPINIYLFGSYAKDTWNDDSDIDIAVVFEKIQTNRLIIAKKLFKLRREIEPSLEPVVFDSRYDPSGFLEQIRKEGIQLFPAD